MQYNVSSPSEYLEILEDDWRKEKLIQIRHLILKSAPEIEESIDFKMLRFGNATQTLFHLNAQKNYVSLYTGNTQKIDPSGALLQGLNIGKGCLRFSKSKKIEETRIKEFIKKGVSLWRSGKDLGC